MGARRNMVRDFAARAVEQMGDKYKGRSVSYGSSLTVVGVLSHLLGCPVPVPFVSWSYRARLGGKEDRGRKWNRDRSGDMPCM
jgi:hypothetical protein